MDIFRKGPLSQEQIIQWLLALRGHAYVPESGFIATAVFRAALDGVDDYYFAGVNVENTDHRLSSHGEEGCIAAMVAGLGKRARIAEGWVMGASKDIIPGKNTAADVLASCCGKCRQQIAGLADKDVKIHSVSLNGKVSTTTVDSFLPGAFSLSQGITEAKKSGGSTPAAEKIQKKILRRGNLSEKDIFDWLEEIDSVDFVSKVSQAVVLQLGNGAYTAGSKVEDAAFVGMNAAQSALAIAVTAFGLHKVQAVWVYTAGAANVLTLSALQVLAPVVENVASPVNFFSREGKMTKMTLAQAVASAAARH